MRRLASFGMTIALCTIALAGCARREAPPPRPGPPRPPTVEVRPLSTPDYFATAASIDLFEIRSGEMARSRARDFRLRDFASMMIRDHEGTSAQLSFAGRRLILLPSQAMRPEHQAMIDRLAASSDFDAAYRGQQIAVHEAALRLHSAYAARGDSPTLRPVAANAASVVRRHLDHLRAM